MVSLGKVTIDKTHLLNVYDSMILSQFTGLYAHHQGLVLEHFHHVPKKSHVHYQPLATTNLLSTYMNFSILNTS